MEKNRRSTSITGVTHFFSTASHLCDASLVSPCLFKQWPQNLHARTCRVGLLVPTKASISPLSLLDSELLHIHRRAAMVEGEPHPDPIVETSSLASIKAPQPTYSHHLQKIQEDGLLSDAQLETIVYANMRFKTTVDGGGVNHTPPPPFAPTSASPGDSKTMAVQYVRP